MYLNVGSEFFCYDVFVSHQVPYNITNWLEKNKDPLNETVVEMLSHSKEALVQTLFRTPDAAGLCSTPFDWLNTAHFLRVFLFML